MGKIFDVIWSILISITVLVIIGGVLVASFASSVIFIVIALVGGAGLLTYCVLTDKDDTE